MAYEYQEYPKYLYHPKLAPEGKVFQNAEETKGLKRKGWVDTPAKFPKPSRFRRWLTDALKWESLIRNPSVLFILAVIAIPLGLLAWMYPDFWKRAESPPVADLRLKFFGRDRLSFDYENTGQTSGSQPKPWFAVLDLSRPFFPSGSTEPNGLPILPAVDANDFVRPGESQGNTEVLNTALARQHVQIGDKLWGAAWITCENCLTTHAYYFYFEVGSGGWYAEVKDRKKMEFPKPPSVPATDAAITQYANEQVPEHSRIAIPASIF